MTEWQYYACWNPAAGSPESPRTMVRKRVGDHDFNVQGLDRAGKWRKSFILYEISIGKGDLEAAPITHAEAVAFVRGWHARGGILQIPEGLD